jgi:hypothetical protein
MNNKIKEALVAPCGMNCGLCSAYLAYSHNMAKAKGKISHCTGCRPRNKQCAFLARDCDLLRENKINFCFECKKFPCDNLKHIDDHYSTKYGLSFIENLNYIKDNSLEKFISRQKRKYKCSSCGDVICIHNKKCYSCDKISSWKG